MADKTKSTTFYNKRVWLNPDNSPSTGNVVCYDGCYYDEYAEKTLRQAFLSISDCHQSVRLHKTNSDDIKDFKNKLILLRDTIDEFIKHL